jgi:hypothetical protein
MVTGKVSAQKELVKQLEQDVAAASDAEHAAKVALNTHTKALDALRTSLWTQQEQHEAEKVDLRTVKAALTDLFNDVAATQKVGSSLHLVA